MSWKSFNFCSDKDPWSWTSEENYRYMSRPSYYPLSLLPPPPESLIQIPSGTDLLPLFFSHICISPHPSTAQGQVRLLPLLDLKMQCCWTLVEEAQRASLVYVSSWTSKLQLSSSLWEHFWHPRRFTQLWCLMLPSIRLKQLGLCQSKHHSECVLIWKEMLENIIQTGEN